MVSSGSALTVLPPTFGELVNESGRILRGRVTAVHSYQTTTPNGTPVIKTHVTWQVENALKGAPGATFSLDFLGGRVGTAWLRVSGMPQFKVGDDDYLFVESNESVMCPLIAAEHGRYRIRRDAATGREYVARENGVPLRNVAEVSSPMGEGAAAATASAADAASAAAQAYSPAEFEAEIRAVLDHNATADTHANF